MNALELATAFEGLMTPDHALEAKAAAELRRLHAVNAELVEALEKAVRTCFDRYSHHEVTADPRHFVNVALAKHKGEQG